MDGWRRPLIPVLVVNLSSFKTIGPRVRIRESVLFVNVALGMRYATTHIKIWNAPGAHMAILGP